MKYLRFFFILLLLSLTIITNSVLAGITGETLAPKSLSYTCTDTADHFSGSVTVSSYSTSTTNVCTGEVTSSSGENFKVKFQAYSGSSYSSQAIEASLKTACKVLEEAHTRAVSVRMSGEIEECTLGIMSYNKISAYNIVYGNDDSGAANAFSGSARGDTVSVSGATVPEYLVYSNQAHNYCSPYFASSEGDFEGMISVDTSATVKPLILATKYTNAIARCDALLQAALDGDSVDVAGTIYNAPGSSTIINADVKITSVR